LHDHPFIRFSLCREQPAATATVTGAGKSCCRGQNYHFPATLHSRAFLHCIIRPFRVGGAKDDAGHSPHDKPQLGVIVFFPNFVNDTEVA